MTDMPLTLSAIDTAAALGWLRRAGRGDGDKVRCMYRAGRFPAPIDPSLCVRWWSFSRRRVEECAGPPA